jgi:hypothetical protein
MCPEAAIEPNPLLDRLNPNDGRRLLELGADLVWATSWMADANDEVSPRLGLPKLPIVEWSDAADNPPNGLHWKTQDPANWAAGRPFIWIDDEIRAADRDWVAQHYHAPSLLHRVDPRHGVTDSDFTYLGQWLAAQDGNDLITR